MQLQPPPSTEDSIRRDVTIITMMVDILTCKMREETTIITIMAAVIRGNEDMTMMTIATETMRGIITIIIIISQISGLATTVTDENTAAGRGEEESQGFHPMTIVTRRAEKNLADTMHPPSHPLLRITAQTEEEEERQGIAIVMIPVQIGITADTAQGIPLVDALRSMTTAAAGGGE